MRRLLIAAALFGSTLFASSALLHTSNKNELANCIAVYNGIQSQVCPTESTEQPLNWYAWANFKNKSVQIHFLDLVELIFGSEPQKNVPRGNVDKQSLIRS